MGQREKSLDLFNGMKDCPKWVKSDVFADKYKIKYS